jgi:NAD-dependent SIR2 family protein deacetylase
MAITVGTSATKIYPASAVEHEVQVRNNGAAIISVGKSSTVTVASGMTIASGATQEVDLAPGEELYAIVPSGTATVDVL